MSKKIYNKPIYKLRDQIPANKTSLWGLSLNTHPYAMELIAKEIENEDNIPKINWANICSNRSDGAMELLKKRPDQINGNKLSYNSNDKAFELLKKYPDKINWNNIQINLNIEKAVDLIVKYPQSLNNDYYLNYYNDKYIDYLEENKLDNLKWEKIANPIYLEKCKKGIELIIKYHPILYEHYSNRDEYKKYVSLINDDKIMDLLEKYPKSIDGSSLSQNCNDKAMVLLEKHPELIDWNKLSLNSKGTCILSKHLNKINYKNLMKNRNEKIIDILEDTNNQKWISLPETEKKECLSELCNNINEKIIKYMIEKYPTYIDFSNILKNRSNSALHYLVHNKIQLVSDNANFKLLAKNTNDNAFELLQVMLDANLPNSTVNLNEDCIHLCKNSNPRVFDFIKNNFHKINLKTASEIVKKEFKNLLERKETIEFVEYFLDAERIKNLYLEGNKQVLDNFEVILDWELLFRNPEIFILDKEAMLKNFEPLGREIINYQQTKIEKLLEKKNTISEPVIENRYVIVEKIEDNDDYTIFNDNGSEDIIKETKNKEDNESISSEIDFLVSSEEGIEDNESISSEIDFLVSSEEGIENIEVQVKLGINELINMIKRKQQEEENSDDDNTSQEGTISISPEISSVY